MQSSTGNPPPDQTGGHTVFATTRWSVVLAAGRSDTAASRAALEHLCSIYWPPLYAYARRRGYSPADAQDMTQEFFATFLEQGWVADADATKGRFRTFLLTAFSRFLANQWHRAMARKRGGGLSFTNLNTETAERSYTAALSANPSPDSLYDRQWAMTLLDRALSRTSREQTALGKDKEFKVLSPYLAADRGEIPYPQLATTLGVTEATARQAVHRLRKRFREFFREEISNTVADPSEIEEEIRHLLAALAA